MRSLPAGAAAIVAAATVALGAGAAAAASSSGPPVRTYIPTPARSELVYRPGRLYLEYGPELVAKDIHWQYWHHGDAQATANLVGCDDGCFGLGHVTLHFYDARYLRMNASEFVRVHIIHANSGLGARYWRWDASADTWTG
jgi:hypothetical protein